MFAFNRSRNDKKPREKKEKRGPFAGLLGRKPADSADALPEIDVAAGLSRVLRTPSPAGEPQMIDSADPIRDALASIEAALYAIDTIRDIIEQACDVALSAQSVEDAGGRALLAESYDELRLSIGKTIDDLDERAGLLIGKNQRSLDVKLGGKAHYSVSATRLDLSPRGLNLEPPRDAFATFEEISDILSQLDSALNKADRTAAGYCRDAQFLMVRMAQAQQAA